MPFSLILFRYCAVLMRMVETRWPSPSNMYLPNTAAHHTTTTRLTHGAVTSRDGRSASLLATLVNSRQATHVTLAAPTVNFSHTPQFSSTWKVAVPSHWDWFRETFHVVQRSTTATNWSVYTYHWPIYINGLLPTTRCFANISAGPICLQKYNKNNTNNNGFNT